MAYDFAVIGGGAAGLAGAVAAARLGDRVIVLEHGASLGRKILASGNGRCNLMNSGELRYFGDAGFAEKVIHFCGAMRQREFWHQLGLLLTEDTQERIYPCTFQAQSVLDALRLGLDSGGVEVRLNVPVRDLNTDAGEFRIDSGRESIYDAFRTDGAP